LYGSDVFRRSKLAQTLTAVVTSRRKKIKARGPQTRGDFLRSLWK
jgi:hypothetical protein